MPTPRQVMMFCPCPACSTLNRAYKKRNNNKERYRFESEAGVFVSNVSHLFGDVNGCLGVVRERSTSHLRLAISNRHEDNNLKTQQHIENCIEVGCCPLELLLGLACVGLHSHRDRCFPTTPLLPSRPPSQLTSLHMCEVGN